MMITNGTFFPWKVTPMLEILITFYCHTFWSEAHVSTTINFWLMVWSWPLLLTRPGHPAYIVGVIFWTSGERCLLVRSSLAQFFLFVTFAWQTVFVGTVGVTLQEQCFAIRLIWDVWTEVFIVSVIFLFEVFLIFLFFSLELFFTYMCLIFFVGRFSCLHNIWNLDVCFSLWCQVRDVFLHLWCFSMASLKKKNIKGACRRVWCQFPVLHP